MARPSKYDKIDQEQVKKLANRGWTDKEMSDFFGVCEKTWNNWKKKHEEFLQSLKDWKLEADERVERSLYERATGYSHPDTHVSNYQGDVTLTPLIKEYPPDPTSMIFWLKNRKKEQWRDKPGEGGDDDETQTPVDIKIEVVDGRKPDSE
jgi:hypothetical protein